MVIMGKKNQPYTPNGTSMLSKMFAIFVMFSAWKLKMEKVIGEINPSKKLCRSGGSDSEVDGDIISNLPENVLCEILSRLPTAAAVRTSVLSRQWEYKWTNVYNLSFDDRVRPTLRGNYKLNKQKKADFLYFVDRVLMHCLNWRVKEFKLWCYNQYNLYRLKTWISALLTSNVETIHICYSGGLVFPSSFFSCKSLMQLELRRCTFKVPTKVCLSNLRSLHFDSVGFLYDNSADSGQLFFSFPVLEELKLFDCHWLNVQFLKIHAPLLASLEMRYSKYKSASDESKNFDCEIEISGDSLSNFIHDGYFLEKIQLSNLSKVINASLTLSEHHSTSMGKMGSRAHLFLGEFSSTIRCLELSGNVIEALVLPESQCSLPIFDRLTCLKVPSTWQNSTCPGPLMELLNRAPALEKLIFSLFMMPSHNHEEIELVPANFSSHLKVVEFEGFHGTRAEIELVKFLLQSMLGLEKMIIDMKYLPSPAAKTEFQKQLLTFPKGSSNLSIVFLSK